VITIKERLAEMAHPITSASGVYPNEKWLSGTIPTKVVLSGVARLTDDFWWGHLARYFN